jgi:tetratricopeptide (TPR) repeat protein
VYYEKAIHLKQEDVDAHTNMGFWYLLRGGDNQLDFAKQECEIAIQLMEKDNGNYPWTYICLASVYKKLGLMVEQHAAIEKARKLFELHIGQDATNFWAYFGLGCCCTEGERKDIAKAIECDKRALKIKPDFVPAQYNLACDFALKGAAPEAVAALSDILSGPRDVLKFFGIESDLDFKAIATTGEFVRFMDTMNLKYSHRSLESELKNAEAISK